MTSTATASSAAPTWISSREHWNETVPPGDLSMGDASGDGFVGSSDLDTVRANWGESLFAAAVPEPGMGILMLLGATMAGAVAAELGAMIHVDSPEHWLASSQWHPGKVIRRGVAKDWPAGRRWYPGKGSTIHHAHRRRPLGRATSSSCRTRPTSGLWTIWTPLFRPSSFILFFPVA